MTQVSRLAQRNGTPAASSAKRGSSTQSDKRTGIRPLHFLFHTATAAYMVMSFQGVKAMSDIGAMKYPAKNIPALDYGGQFKYLTILGMVSSTISMAVAALEDLMPGIHFLHQSKRIFALLSLPVEITIASIYWSLMAVAPGLILPPHPAAASGVENAPSLYYIPLWIDLGLHLVPALALIIDFFFLEKKYLPPTSTRSATFLAFSATFGYAVWVERCARYNNGTFPYPFLTVLPVDGRLLVYGAAGMFARGVFSILNALHK